jgi:Protein of unknown function (DUF2568)
MLSLLQNANLALRFALELALLGAVGCAAWRLVPQGGLRVVATVGLPLAVAVVWATVVHGAGVPGPVRLAAQVVLFGATVAGLAAARHVGLAAGFAAAVLANAVLMTLWAQ